LSPEERERRAHERKLRLRRKALSRTKERNRKVKYDKLRAAGMQLAQPSGSSTTAATLPSGSASSSNALVAQGAGKKVVDSNSGVPPTVVGNPTISADNVPNGVTSGSARQGSKKKRRLGQTKEIASFGDCGSYCMGGRRGKNLINAAIIMTQWGFCVAYLIFIPENVQKIICYETKLKACPSLTAICLFTCLLLLPFVFLPSLKTLVIPMLLSNVALFVGIGWGYMNALSPMRHGDRLGEALDPIEAETEAPAPVTSSTSTVAPSEALNGAGSNRPIYQENSGEEASMSSDDNVFAQTDQAKVQLRRAVAPSSSGATKRRFLGVSPFFQQHDGLAAPQQRRLPDTPNSLGRRSERPFPRRSPKRRRTARNAAEDDSDKEVQAVSFPNNEDPNAAAAPPPPGGAAAPPPAGVPPPVTPKPPPDDSMTGDKPDPNMGAVPPPVAAGEDEEDDEMQDDFIGSYTSSSTTSSTTTEPPVTVKPMRHRRMPSYYAINFRQYPVFFGIAMFTFEGIGLLLPTRRAMNQPEHMPRLLRIAMIFLTSLFCSFGLVCYLRWGGQPDAEDGGFLGTAEEDVRRMLQHAEATEQTLDDDDSEELVGVASMITFNYPQNRITSFVILFYALGIFFTFPMQLFPVSVIVENSVFIRARCCLPHRRRILGWVAWARSKRVEEVEAEEDGSGAAQRGSGVTTLEMQTLDTPADGAPTSPSSPPRRPKPTGQDTSAFDTLPLLNFYERCIVRGSLVFVAGLCALSVPHFGLFLSLVGAVTCNFLAFIAPSYFHYFVTVIETRPRRHEPAAVKAMSTEDQQRVSMQQASDGAAMRQALYPTPKEDLGYIIFGVLAGLWSFSSTLVAFIGGEEGNER